MLLLYFVFTLSVLGGKFIKNAFDSVNVNMQLVEPISPFDQYWQGISPRQQSHPSAAILSTILGQLQQNDISTVIVSSYF